MLNERTLTGLLERDHRSAKPAGGDPLSLAIDATRKRISETFRDTRKVAAKIKAH